MKHIIIVVLTFFNVASSAIEIGKPVKIKTVDTFHYPRVWKSSSNEIRISSIVKRGEDYELQTFDLDSKLVSVYKLPVNYLSYYASETAFFPEIKKYIFHRGKSYFILDPENGEIKEFKSDFYIASGLNMSLTNHNGEYQLLVFAPDDDMNIIEYWDLSGNKLSTFKVPGVWSYKQHTHFVIDNKDYITVAYDSAIMTFDLMTGTLKGSDSNGCNFRHLASRTVEYGGKPLIVVPSQSGCFENELKPYDKTNGIVLLDPFTFAMVKQYSADPIDCIGNCYNMPDVIKTKNQTKILFGTDAPTEPEKKKAYAIDIQSSNKELISFPSWSGELNDRIILLNVSRNFEDNQYLYRVYTFYDLNGNKLSSLKVGRTNWEPPQKAGSELFTVDFDYFNGEVKRDQLVLLRLY